jgi:hypothetical protein
MDEEIDTHTRRVSNSLPTLRSLRAAFLSTHCAAVGTAIAAAHPAAAEC